MAEKIFSLWDNHTTGFCRVLLALLIPSAIWKTFGVIMLYTLLMLWLIIKTGYENKWGDE